jgi:hypothetical protein
MRFILHGQVWVASGSASGAAVLLRGEHSVRRLSACTVAD